MEEECCCTKFLCSCLVFFSCCKNPECLKPEINSEAEINSDMRDWNCENYSCSCSCDCSRGDWEKTFNWGLWLCFCLGTLVPICFLGIFLNKIEDPNKYYFTMFVMALLLLILIFFIIYISCRFFDSKQMEAHDTLSSSIANSNVLCSRIANMLISSLGTLTLILYVLEYESRINSQKKVILWLYILEWIGCVLLILIGCFPGGQYYRKKYSLLNNKDDCVSYLHFIFTAGYLIINLIINVAYFSYLYSSNNFAYYSLAYFIATLIFLIIFCCFKSFCSSPLSIPFILESIILIFSSSTAIITSLARNEYVDFNP